MMRRISYLLYILFTLAFVSSCNTMDDMLDENKDAATLTVKIAQQDPTTVTRAISDAIENVNVLVFDAQGHLIGSTYASSSPTSVYVSAREGSGCTVCAIANTGSSSYFDGISTLTELQAKVTPALGTADVLGAKSNEILYGTIPDVTLSSGANTQTVSLRRLYSKYTFTITPSSDIVITSYQLCNVPNECYIASGNTSNPTTGFAGLNFTAVATPVYAGTVVNAGPYYIYENLAGTASASNTAELRTAANAPTGSSYLLITARGTGYNAGWTSTYRVYLGGVTNATTPVIDYTNFNINRDFNYQCNIAISGSGANDVRVTYTPTTSTRTNVYFGDATPGNYLYSDGTTGRTLDKTVVGIVFSNQLSSAEYAKGYTHGYALALQDVSTSTIAYKATNSDAGLTKVQTLSAYYNDINAGYYGTFTLHYDKSNATYPAWQAANNYNVNVSGFTNSGWYLPSMGQWWDVCANLGSVDLRTKQALTTQYGDLYTGGGTATTNVNNAIKAAGGTALSISYWSASEYNSLYAVRVPFNSSNVYVDYCSKTDAHYVRAVLAF
ncbi:DUF4906 domain-containing protein [Prevotella sp.]|uniref:DUF4906 domain-containing protein n=1 Tax=Prevotella sp. TaxID=59823 RepID=UPI00264A0F97|nr:DUF4906 domain-containing protein [Prevotella sp.]MDN5554784.1 DUF4906 domain-containing protein [Prevotella sp.]